MFISPEVMAQMPLLIRLFATQPVISGSLTLIVLHALLCGTPPKDASTLLE
jgi:hypothetical protein